jgi:hypothetical protein
MTKTTLQVLAIAALLAAITGVGVTRLARARNAQQDADGFPDNPKAVFDIALDTGEPGRRHLTGRGSIAVKFKATHRTTILGGKHQVVIQVMPLKEEKVLDERKFNVYEMGLNEVRRDVFGANFDLLPGMYRVLIQARDLRPEANRDHKITRPYHPIFQETVFAIVE